MLVFEYGLAIRYQKVYRSYFIMQLFILDEIALDIFLMIH